MAEASLDLTGLGWAPRSVLVVHDATTSLAPAVATTSARSGLAVTGVDGPAGFEAAAELGPLRHLLVTALPTGRPGSTPSDAAMASVEALMAVTEAWLAVAGDAAASAVFVTGETGAAGAVVVAPATLGYTRHLGHRLGGRIRFNTVLLPPPGDPTAPEDIARAALFLLSPAASYVTGTSLRTGSAA